MRDKSLLVVDDDHEICQVVKGIFESAGARVHTSYSGKHALRQFFELRPDLVLLDIMMPGMDGFEVLKRIRQLSDVPVVMLTVKDSHEDIVRSLNAGADDHVTKPFHVDELLARTRAVLRRAASQDRRSLSAVYDDGYLHIDVGMHRVLVSDEPVRLTAKEFDLLAYLVNNAGRICTFDQILDNVWGAGQHRSAHNVYTFIYQLRKKLEPDPLNPVYLIVSPGIGYTFKRQD